MELKHGEGAFCEHNNYPGSCLMCFALQGQPQRTVQRVIVEEPRPYIPNTIIEEEDAEDNRVLLCSHGIKLFTTCAGCQTKLA